MSADLVNNIATFVGVFVAILGAFLFAFWAAMGIWTFNDIRSRSRDWLAILLACIMVLIFPIVGLILYTMIRPKATLAEVYDRALEEEALLRELEESQACHSCGVPVKDNWVYCPNCHSQLQHPCTNCGNLARNEWNICVFCGTPQRQGAGQGAMQGAGQVAGQIPGQIPNQLPGQVSGQFANQFAGQPAQIGTQLDGQTNGLDPLANVPLGQGAGQGAGQAMAQKPTSGGRFSFNRSRPQANQPMPTQMPNQPTDPSTPLPSGATIPTTSPEEFQYRPPNEG
ncbi:MAG: zinc ribbon domain-containing protein [Chloroflexota bacterium]